MIRCWHDTSSGNYYVSDAILFVVDEEACKDGTTDSKSTELETKNEKTDASKEVASAPTKGSEDNVGGAPEGGKGNPGVTTESHGPNGEKEGGTNKQVTSSHAQDDDAEGDAKSTALSKDPVDLELESLGPVDSVSAAGGDDDKSEKEAKPPQAAGGQNSDKNGTNPEAQSGAGRKDDDTHGEAKNTSSSSGGAAIDKDTGDKTERKEAVEGKRDNTQRDVAVSKANSGPKDNTAGNGDVPKDVAPSNVAKGAAKELDTESDANPPGTKSRMPRPALAEDAAYLLAFFVAREHPNPAVLERFVMCHRHRS
jgi:hypothetical protein